MTDRPGCRPDLRAGGKFPAARPGGVRRFVAGHPVWHGRFPRRGSLARRLLVSYLVVVVVDIAVFVLSALVVSPLPRNAPALNTQSKVDGYLDSLGHSLLRALFVGAAISLIVGVVATVIITGLLLEPLSRLRAAARRLSQGHYGEQIAPPYPPELVELAADLNQLAARLTDVETRRARLVSDLAHELRTPLTIIEGQLIGVSDDVYDFTGELVDSVREELGRLRRLTEDLSGLSRAEENAYDLKVEHTDLAALVLRVTDLMRPQFDHAGVQLTVTCASVVVVIDADRVTQILANLLSNALIATPPGGRVEVTLRTGEQHVVVEVIDTGHGIAQADLDRIFDRFERVIPPLDQANGGSGIGLTIARALARAHGGEVAARSPGPGKGATFTLSLLLPLTLPLPEDTTRR